jgi:predicted AlkP superfamily pyrophosphatase or phosphodiesterase
MQRTAVINAVGLTPRLVGPNTPRIRAFADQGRMLAISPMAPAVTCSVQATYLTGTWPDEHGVVGNGWYSRDEAEVKFWRQSNHLVRRPKVWEAARAIDPAFTCANLFWWFNMYSSADYTVTPRPMYPADGRKIPDVYTQPSDLREALQAELGAFPLFDFWGPATSIRSTRWIAEAAMWVERRHAPTLSLVYLPHLDYCLQRFGPDGGRVAGDLRDLDAVCGDLIDFYSARDVQVIILSEYGIAPVQRPVHLNRVLREAGLVAVREEMGLELLDAGASRAFAVADHQVAHVYVNDESCRGRVRSLLEAADGVAELLDEAGKQAHHLDHPRAGDFVALAEPDAWFTYYYWMDDRRAPDFARTVDIHRKPGYDPVELFLDPRLKAPKLKVAWTLLRKQLGFRTLLDVIPLDALLVRGSHGLPAASVADGPLCIIQQPVAGDGQNIAPTEVFALIVRHLGVASSRLRVPA